MSWEVLGFWLLLLSGAGGGAWRWPLLPSAPQRDLVLAPTPQLLAPVGATQPMMRRHLQSPWPPRIPRIGADIGAQSPMEAAAIQAEPLISREGADDFRRLGGLKLPPSPSCLGLFCHDLLQTLSFSLSRIKQKQFPAFLLQPSLSSGPRSLSTYIIRQREAKNTILAGS